MRSTGCGTCWRRCVFATPPRRCAARCSSNGDLVPSWGRWSPACSTASRRITGVEFLQTLYSDVESVQTVLAGGDLRIYSRLDEDGAWVLNTRARVEPENVGTSIDFSTMFFAAKEDDGAEDRYRLIVEAAKYADRMGFRSVWVPERHFTQMGSLYPNPSVLHAALARETQRVRLMAGSVVMPL